LKPLSFTASVNTSVRAPREIYRAPVEEKPTYLYTKGGDIGLYPTLFALLPDYGVGFTVLVAGADPSNVQLAISELVASIMSPTLEKAAKVEAMKKYAGTYRQEGGNGTMVLDVLDGPSLIMTKWMADGTNVKEVLGQGPVRLYPSGL
jgi:hypothetical protein